MKKSEIQKRADVQRLFAENGNKLPAHAFPGGYAIRYLNHWNHLLCADCAQYLMEDPDPFDDRDLPVDYFIYEEGPSRECDGGCGQMLESEYGDPDAEEEE